MYSLISIQPCFLLGASPGFGEFSSKDLWLVGLEPNKPIEVTTQFDIPFDEDENYKVVIRPQKDQATVDTASICLTNC